MPAPGADSPILWIVAGANGSGKSSAFEDLRVRTNGGTVWIIDPDRLARRIAQIEGHPLPHANLLAVRRLETWLYASVDAHQKVGVETVLSTDKYLKLARFAHERKLWVRLIYVALSSAELNVERVALRVAKGGHAVPKDKITSRRARSLANLPQFLAEADDAFIFDNSGQSPLLVAGKADGDYWVQEDAMPELAASVNDAATLAPS